MSRRRKRTRNADAEAIDRAVPSPTDRLFEPIDPAPMVYFRIVFGAIVLWDVAHFALIGAIREVYLDPPFFFTYDGFEWVRPLPGRGMYALYYLLGFLAALVTLGLYYRVAAALFTAGYLYVFLICKSMYMNHYYLIALLGLAMIVVPANVRFSVDAAIDPEVRRRRVPAWSLWLLRAQIGVVYVFGGIAKLNADWLGGEPMRTWLARRTSELTFGPFFRREWVVYAFSYGGLLIDLLAVPLLFWRPARPFALVALLAFHLTNAYLFDIGIFPWLMLAALPIFLPSSMWARLVRRPNPETTEIPAPPSSRSRGLTMVLLALYGTAQLLVPLRHHLYPGDVNWTEEGHYFSWHMKLREKAGDVLFLVTDPASGRSEVADPDGYLSPRQRRKMAIRPHMIHQFARHLADLYADDGRPGVRVRALAVAALNGRPAQRLIDEKVDLAAQPRTLGHAPWIVPLARRPPPVADEAPEPKGARSGPNPDRDSEVMSPMGPDDEGPE